MADITTAINTFLCEKAYPENRGYISFCKPRFMVRIDCERAVNFALIIMNHNYYIWGKIYLDVYMYGSPI